MSFILRIYKAFFPTSVDKVEQPIKFGIIGATADIVPPALIIPAKSHPEVVIYAVAARSKDRAEAFAKKYGVEKAYGAYQELLDDPEVEAVYNPLPNGLHFEWTMKALQAGKHVLLEKPSSNTAAETRAMFELAESKGLVLLEAFHYRFHPAVQRVKEIINNGDLGSIKSISTSLGLFKGPLKDSNIRFDLALGGGAMMDMGCYTLNSMRYLASSDPVSVLSASAEEYNPGTNTQIDRATEATLTFPSDIIGTLKCDLARPPIFGFIPRMPYISIVVECEGGTVKLLNYVAPTLYHCITITQNGKSRVEKAYTFGDEGEDWWLTYRYQLEAFVNRLKGRQVQTWITKEDSIANMEWIEKIYEKTGLGSRPTSAYKPT